MTLLDSALRRIVATKDTEFRPFTRYGKPVERLSWLPLSDECETDGSGLYLLRFEPGGVSKPHEHSNVEEFIMLEGELVDCDERVFKAGDFVRYAAGSKHFSTSPDGCLLLALLREPNRALSATEIKSA